MRIKEHLIPISIGIQQQPQLNLEGIRDFPNFINHRLVPFDNIRGEHLRNFDLFRPQVRTERRYSKMSAITVGIAVLAICVFISKLILINSKDVHY